MDKESIIIILVVINLICNIIIYFNLMKLSSKFNHLSSQFKCLANDFKLHCKKNV